MRHFKTVLSSSVFYLLSLIKLYRYYKGLLSVLELYLVIQSELIIAVKYNTVDSITVLEQRGALITDVIFVTSITSSASVNIFPLG